MKLFKIYKWIKFKKKEVNMQKKQKQKPKKCKIYNHKLIRLKNN